MRGWIIDCYPDHERDAMVVWIKTVEGVRRIVDEGFRPELFIWAPAEDLVSMPRRLEMIGIGGTSLVRRKLWLGERERTVLRVPVDRYGDILHLARIVDRWGIHGNYRLFNVDLRLDQRYLLGRGVFPMGLMEIDGLRPLDSPYRHDYPLPPLREVELSVDVDAGSGIPTFNDPVAEIRVNDIVLDGGEEQVLEDLGPLIYEIDPDVIYTARGDDFYLPHLMHRAEENGIGLDLGREKGARRSKEKSYFTYGRILYKPPAYKLRGRIHIDREQSFWFSESGMYGLIDLSRLSLIPVQDLSRLSPGSAISAMQVNEAIRTGYLVPWKKNVPEDFKTARELLTCDRGGFIFDPEVGIHDRVVEVDFASLYPNIMVRFNISPETLMCECCPRSRRIVPGIGYRICERTKGFIPRVLEPIIRRRAACKRLARESPGRTEIYRQRARALKWILVTCFGYTGYRNARFGRIECYESITAYGREILLGSAEIAERMDFRVLHGIVDSLWLAGESDPVELCDRVYHRFGIPLEVEGRYRWIVFLPCVSTGAGALNRYYGLLETGEMKERGIAIRRRDTPTIVKEMQRDMLLLLSETGNSDEFVGNIPTIIGIMENHASALRDQAVPPHKLLLTRRISRGLEEYRQFNDQVAALEQLRSRGFRVPPGKVVSYIVCDSGSRDPWKRVRVDHFMEGGEDYDAESYVNLVVRGTAELLSPFGWDLGALRDRLDG